MLRLAPRRPPVELSARTRALFDHLRALAEVGAVTPLTADMLKHLRGLGHDAISNKGVIAYEIARLEQASLIHVHGAQAHRTFEILATGHRTTTRPKIRSAEHLAAMARAAVRRVEEAAGWPRVTKESAASYDSTVKRRVFGQARHQSGETARPIQAVRGAYGNRSLTGCAAQMVAA